MTRIEVVTTRARRTSLEAGTDRRGAHGGRRREAAQADEGGAEAPCEAVQGALSPAPFLVVVCEDLGGMPGVPQAFVTSPHQGVNYAAETWHGVLTPLDGPQDFLVVDRAGEGPNLEEYRYPEPWTIVVESIQDPGVQPSTGPRD